ncbi:transmembrane protein, putative (macronuclear) [Tetrahymena thermophila SB210]|uniref:Transmembrane protein, putative n=1 Tax=Tetrahymena thermophila (strain SB210) TaxID=312017 RepID=W7XII7_TETTS|nr:transmembrane protein, putative [Tetrahymena thermophila SB210]EWS73314.1 transmembrane protein, putative [Tetrahymena thermophila SB210]|eukprot:XP_012654163.1 transmembrane protein, putative [Tetrahymena thermophila SB210]
MYFRLQHKKEDFQMNFYIFCQASSLSDLRSASSILQHFINIHQMTTQLNAIISKSFLHPLYLLAQTYLHIFNNILFSSTHQTQHTIHSIHYTFFVVFLAVLIKFTIFVTHFSYLTLFDNLNYLSLVSNLLDFKLELSFYKLFYFTLPQQMLMQAACQRSLNFLMIHDFLKVDQILFIHLKNSDQDYDPHEIYLDAKKLREAQNLYQNYCLKSGLNQASYGVNSLQIKISQAYQQIRCFFQIIKKLKSLKEDQCLPEQGFFCFSMEKNHPIKNFYEHFIQFLFLYLQILLSLYQ